jgi:hypothetical protein
MTEAIWFAQFILEISVNIDVSNFLISIWRAKEEEYYISVHGKLK